MSDDLEVSECFDSSESEMESEDSGEDWEGLFILSRCAMRDLFLSEVA